MYKHTTVKKSLILLVVALLCMAVLLSACSEKPFTSNFTAPTGQNVDSNGGIAVKYGEYIYYVNGYESSAGATNSYVDTSDAPRVGSVVRIKASVIEEALAEHDKDQTSSEKTKAIAKIVNENTEIVVPKIYYSGNTTTAELNGIYIFNDRLYMLTPNDKLTPAGNKQTEQSVLMSFDLAGGNAQRHYTFTNNAAQIWLYQNANGDVMATYLMDSKLHVLEIKDDEKSVDTLIDEDKEDATVSSANFDLSVNGECVFFLDSDGSICKLAKGAKEKVVLVNNATAEGEDESTITYTISSVSNGYVYYTKADSKNTSISGKVLYYVKDALTDDEHHVALDTTNVTAKGWKENKLVIVNQNEDGYYGMYLITSTDGKGKTYLLKHGFNTDSITINKIDGDELYYTAGGVTYVKNLAAFENNTGDATNLGTPYAYSMSTSPTGWALPDRVVVGENIYVFTFGTASVSLVKFDPEKKTNGTSTTFTKTAIEA